jgi:hypothetical protein
MYRGSEKNKALNSLPHDELVSAYIKMQIVRKNFPYQKVVRK